MINTNTTDRLSEKRRALTAVRTDLSPAAVKDISGAMNATLAVYDLIAKALIFYCLLFTGFRLLRDQNFAPLRRECAVSKTAMLTRFGESSPLSFEIRASAQASLSGGSKSNRSSERVVHGIRNVTEDATRPGDQRAADFR